MAQGSQLHMEEVADHSTLLSVGSGSLAEGITGVGGAILCILGLAGIASSMMLAVAVIAIGAGLMLQGLAEAARFSHILEESHDVPHEHAQVGTGVSAETVGGAAGIALGILALIGLVPITLTAAAAIVFGVTLILASGVNYRLNSIRMPYTSEKARTVARQSVAAGADIQMVIGLASTTLGILALVHIASVTLTLIAILSVGVADFLSGASLTGKMLTTYRHTP